MEGPSQQGSSQENVDWGQENQVGPPGALWKGAPFSGTYTAHSPAVRNMQT